MALHIQYFIKFDPKFPPAKEEALRAAIEKAIQARSQNYIENSFLFRDEKGALHQEIYLLAR